MKTTIRLFALAVAVAGLASAAIVPATHVQPKHASMVAISPAVAAAFPDPNPCGPDGCAR